MLRGILMTSLGSYPVFHFFFFPYGKKKMSKIVLALVIILLILQCVSTFRTSPAAETYSDDDCTGGMNGACCTKDSQCAFGCGKRHPDGIYLPNSPMVYCCSNGKNSDGFCIESLPYVPPDDSLPFPPPTYRPGSQ